MLRIKSITSQEIDAWKIAEAGLPVRIVNSAQSAGIETIGELRQWSSKDLLKLRSLGRLSLGHIQSFFALCQQISDGQKEVSNLKEVMDTFLDHDEHTVLSSRYGLFSESSRLSRKHMTLQAIGNEGHKTRERIRQVEEKAKANLQSKLGMVCLHPFYEQISTWLGSAGGTASCRTIMSRIDSNFFEPYQPCAALLLLSDLNPEQLTYMPDFFSTYSQTTLEDIKALLLKILKETTHPLHISEITHLLPKPAQDTTNESFQQTCQAILQYSSEISRSSDDRYFLAENGMNNLLKEAMRSLTLPSHFRTITAALNEKLQPRSQKGAGYVLETLNAHPECLRIERGIYNLLPEHHTSQ